MNYSYPSKDIQALDSNDISLNLSSSSTSSLMSNPNMLLSNDSSPQQPQPANRRVVKSCFWSTVIFSINFVSSILVINLAKW